MRSFNLIVSYSLEPTVSSDSEMPTETESEPDYNSGTEPEANNDTDRPDLTEEEHDEREVITYAFEDDTAKANEEKSSVKERLGISVHKVVEFHNVAGEIQ